MTDASENPVSFVIDFFPMAVQPLTLETIMWLAGQDDPAPNSSTITPHRSIVTPPDLRGIGLLWEVRSDRIKIVTIPSYQIPTSSPLHPLYTSMNDHQTITLLSTIAQEFQQRSSVMGDTDRWVRRGNNIEVYGFYWDLVECKFHHSETILHYVLADRSLPVVLTITLDNDFLVAVGRYKLREKSG
jgi:hypothetical protein